MKEFSQEGLGTKLFVRCGSSLLGEKIFRECERIEQKFSRFLPKSDLSKINETHGGEIDEEFLFLLQKAEEFFEKSDGVFDITVGGILDAWGYNKEYSFQEKQVPQVHIDFSLVKIQKEPSFVSFPKDISLDFGGLGKGYALDRAANIAKQATHLVLDFGGDMFVRGEAQKIALQSPFASDEAIGTILLKDQFFAASSGSVRKWNTRHHLVDPRKNAPADTCSGVFVVGDSGIHCDSAATTLFINPSPSIAKAFGVEFLAVFPNGTFLKSEGFRAEIFS